MHKSVWGFRVFVMMMMNAWTRTQALTHSVVKQSSLPACLSLTLPLPSPCRCPSSTKWKAWLGAPSWPPWQSSCCRRWLRQPERR